MGKLNYLHKECTACLADDDADEPISRGGVTVYTMLCIELHGYEAIEKGLCFKHRRDLQKTRDIVKELTNGA